MFRKELSKSNYIYKDNKMSLFVVMILVLKLKFLSNAYVGLLSTSISTSPPHRHSPWSFLHPPLIAAPYLFTLRFFPTPLLFSTPLLFQTGELSWKINDHNKYGPPVIKQHPGEKLSALPCSEVYCSHMQRNQPKEEHLS